MRDAGYNYFNLYGLQRVQNSLSLKSNCMIAEIVVGSPPTARLPGRSCGTPPGSRLGYLRWQNTSMVWASFLVFTAMRACCAILRYIGILNLGDYCRGYYSCDFVGGTAHWIGSLGYEQSDADTFTQWGADYLKVCLQRYGSSISPLIVRVQYDNCYAVNKTDFVDDYPPIQEEVSAFLISPKSVTY